MCPKIWKIRQNVLSLTQSFDNSKTATLLPLLKWWSSAHLSEFAHFFAIGTLLGDCYTRRCKAHREFLHKNLQADVGIAFWLLFPGFFFSISIGREVSLHVLFCCLWICHILLAFCSNSWCCFCFKDLFSKTWVWGASKYISSI